METNRWQEERFFDEPPPANSSENGVDLGNDGFLETVFEDTDAGLTEQQILSESPRDPFQVSDDRENPQIGSVGCACLRRMDGLIETPVKEAEENVSNGEVSNLAQELVDGQPSG